MLVKHGRPRSVLDVGCGIGHTLYSLEGAPEVEILAGVEPSPLAAAEARRRLPDATIYEGSAEDMKGVPDGAYDAVTMVAVMEHLYDLHRALNEVNRVVRFGGHVGIYTLDFNWLKKLLVALFAFEKCFDVTGGHIRFFTKRSLRAVMEEHGFEPVRYEWDTTYAGIMPQGQNALFRKARDECVLKEPM